MILCKNNSKISIFTVHCSINYVVSENRHLGSVGGGGSFGKPAPGLYRSPTVQKLKYVIFHFRSNNLHDLNPIQIL